MFYDVYSALCKDMGISESKAAESIGLNRAAVAKWKKGAVPAGATLQRFADFFGVTTDYLLGSDQKEMPTGITGEQTQTMTADISEKDIRAAFFNGADPTLTEEEMDAMWEDAKSYMHFKLEQRRKQKNDT